MKENYQVNVLVPQSVVHIYIGTYRYMIKYVLLCICMHIGDFLNII